MADTLFDRLAKTAIASAIALVGLGSAAQAALWQELSIGFPNMNTPPPVTTLPTGPLPTNGPQPYIFDYVPIVKLHFPSGHGECNVFSVPDSCDGIGFEAIGPMNSFELPGLGTVSLDQAFIGGGMWWINDQDWMIDEIDLFGSAFFTPSGSQQPIEGFGKIWAGRQQAVYQEATPGILCVSDFQFPFDACWPDPLIPIDLFLMDPPDDGILRFPVNLRPMHMPEPGTALTLIAGLAGLGFARRRKA